MKTLRTLLAAAAAILLWGAADQAAAGLLAHWKLDETALTPPNTFAAEEVGIITQPNPLANRYQGSFSLNQPSAHPGLGTAVDFGGVNGEIFIDNVPELNALSSDFTWSAWVNPRSTANSPKLFAKYNGGGGTMWSVGLNAAGNLNFTTLGVLDHQSSVFLHKNQWQHVAVTVTDDGGLLDIEMFRNGQSVAFFDNQAPMLAPSGNNWFIGAIGGGIQSFNGKLDDVRVYNNVLGQSEIQQLAALPAAVVVPYADNDPSTGFLYHLNEATGLHSQSPGTHFIADASGNGNDLRTNYDTSNPGSSTSNPGLSPFDGVSGPAGLAAAATQGGSQRMYRVYANADVSVLDKEQFTIEGWIRNPGPGSYAGLVRVDDDSASGGGSYRTGIIQFGLDSNLDQLRLAGFNAAGGWFEILSTDTITFEPDVWYHVAVSYDGDGQGNDSTVRFYFDSQTSISDTMVGAEGTLLGNAVTGVADFRGFNADGLGSIWIGEWAAGQPLNGDIDEVRWTNAVLDRFNLFAIPEPATFSLLAVGLVSLGFVGRRRRKPRRA